MTEYTEEFDHLYDIYDLIPTLSMKIWPYIDEMEYMGKTYWEWSEILGHTPYKRPDGTPRGCQTCGRGTSCILDIFFEGVVQTTIYELSKTGLL